ncbi:MAG: hypothetical protein M5U34_10645 [Chloroflexi bacterium]|nr:hypothetical protein [Chloroflexota bacterium]
MITAVLLLPLDIALRRLVITKRDWQRAWAATFGRLFPQPAPTAQTEQVSRLFQAKERAARRPPTLNEETPSTAPLAQPPASATASPPKPVDAPPFLLRLKRATRPSQSQPPALWPRSCCVKNSSEILSWMTHRKLVPFSSCPIEIRLAILHTKDVKKA